MKFGKVKPGHKEIKHHMILDINMDGKLTGKERFFTGGHRNDPPSSITYYSVVSRDSARVFSLLVLLNNIYICAVDTGNIYLNDECRYKMWCETVPELEGDRGSVIIISRALYGLKSTWAAWGEMFTRLIEKVDFKSCFQYETDVYMKKENKNNGDLYYRYLLVYVDGVLYIGEYLDRLINML